MNYINQHINEIGQAAEMNHHVEINDVEINDDVVTFEMGGVSFIAKFQWDNDYDCNDEPYINVTISELSIVVETWNGHYAALDVTADSEFAFVITSIESQIAERIYQRKLSEAEENHWASLIDAYESSKY